MVLIFLQRAVRQSIAAHQRWYSGFEIAVSVVKPSGCSALKAVDITTHTWISLLNFESDNGCAQVIELVRSAIPAMPVAVGHIFTMSYTWLDKAR